MCTNLGIVIFIPSLAYYRFKLSWGFFSVISPEPLGLEMMDGFCGALSIVKLLST